MLQSDVTFWKKKSYFLSSTIKCVLYGTKVVHPDFGWVVGSERFMVCTLVKMLIIMDGSIQTVQTRL